MTDPKPMKLNHEPGGSLQSGYMPSGCLAVGKAHHKGKDFIAVEDICLNLQDGKYGYVVEADIKGFFDNLDQDWLLELLGLRIDENAFLVLIRQWQKAGMLDIDGQILPPVTGSPEGGVIPTILANVYLHYMLDLWFERVVKSHCNGQAALIRFADYCICAFQYQREADGFYQIMSQRLEKFGLLDAPEKTRILHFSRFHPSLRRRFAFLGFESYWNRDRCGALRVMKLTARKKVQQVKQRMKILTAICRLINSSKSLTVSRWGTITTLGCAAMKRPWAVSFPMPWGMPSNGLNGVWGREAASIELNAWWHWRS